MHLDELAWPEVRAGGVLALPLGSCEQHGPHLPLDTDGRIAVALASALAAARSEVHVAPVLAFGASGEHAGFPGTLSLGEAVLEEAVVELVRSADHFAGCVLVNGHGGNAAAVQRAAERLTAERRRVLSWWPAPPGGDAHAGRTETSLLLALAPERVRVDRAEAGETRPLAELMPDLRQSGVKAVAPNGVLGDPTGASAEEGRRLLVTLADQLVAAYDAWLARRP